MAASTPYGIAEAVTASHSRPDGGMCGRLVRVLAIDLVRSSSAPGAQIRKWSAVAPEPSRCRVAYSRRAGKPSKEDRAVAGEPLALMDAGRPRHRDRDHLHDRLGGVRPPHPVELPGAMAAQWIAKLGWYTVSDVFGFTAGVLGVLDS